MHLEMSAQWQPFRSGIAEWDLFLRRWSPSTMWADPLIFPSTTTSDVWIIPSFRIWGYVLHVEHVSCVITNWPISVSHTFSSLNISLGLTGGNIIMKLLSLSLDLFFKIFPLPGCFPYFIFYRYLFHLLSSGCLVIAVCGSISVHGTS